MSFSVPPILDAGTVTQITSLVTPVTLNTQCGVITTVSADLGANSQAVFTLNNSQITATNLVLLNVQSVGGTVAGTGNVTVQGDNQVNGAINIVLQNTDGGATGAEVFQVSFIVLGEASGDLSRPPIYTYSTVGQATNITTAVTLNTESGKITTQPTGALAANANAAFVFNNVHLSNDAIMIANFAECDSAGAQGMVLVGKAFGGGNVSVTIANGGTAATANAATEINYLIIDPLANLTNPPIFTSGTVAQLVSTAAAVTLNTQCGVITSFAGTIAAGGAVDFIVNNNNVTATSKVYAFVQDFAGAVSTNGIPAVAVTGIAAGQFTIRMMNLHSAAATGANSLSISFLVL
jgi:hypothetical protein